MLKPSDLTNVSPPYTPVWMSTRFDRRGVRGTNPSLCDETRGAPLACWVRFIGLMIRKGARCYILFDLDQDLFTTSWKSSTLSSINMIQNIKKHLHEDQKQLHQQKIVTSSTKPSTLYINIKILDIFVILSHASRANVCHDCRLSLDRVCVFFSCFFVVFLDGRSYQYFHSHFSLQHGHILKTLLRHMQNASFPS